MPTRAQIAICNTPICWVWPFALAVDCGAEVVVAVCVEGWTVVCVAVVVAMVTGAVAVFATIDVVVVVY